ncbi:MAG TPA: glycosyltransferase family 4 protein [Pseudomonadota bacterium]|nr:glycosyltransferase family 4 protein [Pseudomonadota bacterium]
MDLDHNAAPRPAAGCLRVALVSDYYYPDLGGMPEHVHHLALELARRGHAVTVITTAFATASEAPAAASPPAGAAPASGASGRGESAAALPFEVARLGRASGAIIANGSVSRAAVGLGLGAAMRRLLRERGFDVIHVHAPIFPTLALLAIRCAPPSARLVGTLHTHFEDSQLLRLLRRPLQRYLDALDGVIAVSDTALSCMRRLGFACEGEIIPNGVDLAYWQAGRALPDWHDGAVHLVAQARLEPRNHIGTIIEALRLLGARGAAEAPRLRLLVLGEGPQRQALAAQGAGLPVHFAGAVLAERADFVATSDVYCFTAAIASHPMALLEGMAAGRPVLAHDIAGVRELITDGVEGFVLPLGEPRAYAAALGRLAADRDLRRRLGTAAQARVAAFGWPRIAAQIEAFYRALLRK